MHFIANIIRKVASMGINTIDKIMLKIDRTIKEVWINEIKNDLSNSYILYEDTLKNAFYFHLRNKLSDLMEDNNIRIFTEFHDGKLATKYVRADIAIVKIGDSKNDHIRNNIDRIYSIIELKHKGAQVSIDPFISDVEKSIKYIKDKDLKEIQFYLGFIHEGEFSTGEISWLEDKKQERMVQGRLTELSACYYEDQDDMMYTIISYNDMNRDLDT